MSKPEHPLILFVPGLLPKPEPAIHREALLRCLLTGVRRVDAGVADTIEAAPASFDLVAWTYDFYLEHRDFELDRAGVDAVIEQTEPSEADIAEATSLGRRFTRWLYLLGDLVPFLIPHLAPEKVEVHLRDLMRYVGDENGIAAHTREMLKMRLRAADEGGQPVLLIGHSMGSVIAWDSLWELSHSGRDNLRLDTLLTMGSPLGQRFLQERIKGGRETGRDRYPGNVRRWKNMAALGDLTSLDRRLADDFREMLELGLVDSIEDEPLLTYFHYEGELNAHSEYGYLVHEKTARTIVEWWRGHAG
ncbi:MAG: hypothetical protein KJP08_03420 [Gammaproteobacteria bacterium]|nr:hypothetical protein [Gammaproteobacteria bacterium]NNF49542.1 hypothetical protein [Woeseiaceae bacterium]MBT8093836.1 hypothetical protein [Gammaproteobacteria bacterium]MBT8105821.1 hypothetical protein [Gammaproteobacteria bacterium]NNK25835.1 hypothetical protein [Woeseiaceae bacterium]